MYYSVTVFIIVWQCISPEVTVKSFKKSCIPSAMDGAGGMLWDGSEKDGNVRSVCEALAVNMETVTLIVKGR
jgi:hypothetical protein